MGPFRKLLLVGLGVFALHGVQACASDTELNPQPLPPGGGTGEPTQAPPESDDGKTGGYNDNGGSTAGPTTPGSDAGADGGDASDGGAD